MEKTSYVCCEHGTHSIRQVILSDCLICIETKKERDSEPYIREEIHFNPNSYCIECYKSYRNRLLIDSFTYCLGKIFTPNIRAGQYRGFSAENAYNLYQAIFLLPRIEKTNRRVLIYDHKIFSFSSIFYKKINFEATENDSHVLYKIISPIVAVAEYETESKILDSFISHDFCLTRIENN